MADCPNCGSDDLELIDRLQGEARRLRCSACGHEWVRGAPPPPPPTRPDPGGDVLEFRDDEAGYLEWIRRHVGGFVVNCDRSPSPNYLVLHRATCFHISVEVDFMGPAPWTGGGYIKVCSASRRSLEDWASEKVGGQLDPCSRCM
jgi:hypothetical protein